MFATFLAAMCATAVMANSSTSRAEDTAWSLSHRRVFMICRALSRFIERVTGVRHELRWGRAYSPPCSRAFDPLTTMRTMEGWLVPSKRLTTFW